MSIHTIDSTTVLGLEVATVRITDDDGARLVYELACLTCGDPFAQVDRAAEIPAAAFGHTCEPARTGQCPSCDQEVELTATGWLCAHLVPRNVHPDRFCRGERPALAHRRQELRS